MTKVVSMARTSEYWISRARKHRLAGRYDEAMALLAKRGSNTARAKRLNESLRRRMTNWAARKKRRGRICVWRA